jgi:hypothetical protein
VRAGYGSWNDVMTSPLDDVLDAFHFCCFQVSYEETFLELNKPPNR